MQRKGACAGLLLALVACGDADAPGGPGTPDASEPDSAVMAGGPAPMPAPMMDGGGDDDPPAATDGGPPPATGLDASPGAPPDAGPDVPVMDAGSTGTPDAGTPDAGTPSCPGLDCVTVPPLDRTAPSDLFSATEFLYTGPDAPQVDVELGTIEPHRIAVLRGLVTDRDSQPIAGVTISVKDHPEYGSTVTGSDGVFTMAVNGGGLLTIVYARTGYLASHRQIAPGWEQYRWLPDVVLVPLSNTTTVIATGSDAIQVARGDVVTDAAGTRQATLLFPAGVAAQARLSDGSDVPLSEVTIRATEYTVGAAGPKAMPAMLPPATGYTYAVELSADEVEAMGGRAVNFSQPVSLYLENFLGFPTGGLVPAGFYDFTQARWVPSDNGRIIELVDVVSGAATLDVDGDGAADDSAALAALGIDASEAIELASLYAPGTTLWRVPISHFSPWDCNWPYAPPDDAEPPKEPEPERQDDEEAEEEPECEKGCTIEVQNQVVREALPIAGSDLALTYGTDRVEGYRLPYRTTIRLSGDTMPASAKRIELRISIAGRLFESSFGTAPNQQTTFEWDGLDAFGRAVQGATPAVIEVKYVYDAVYVEPADREETFGALSLSTTPLSADNSRDEISLLRTSVVPLGTWDSAGHSLGSWSLSAHHTYDPISQKIHRGDGRRATRATVTDVVSTVVGTGQSPYLTIDSRVDTTGLPAAGVPISEPSDVAIAPDGSLYFSERNGAFIQRVTSEGVVEAVAGDGGAGHQDMPWNDCQEWLAIIDYFLGFEGGAAVDAEIYEPDQLALGPDGSLYFRSMQGSAIQRVSPDGILTTVAGRGPIWNCPTPRTEGNFDGLNARDVVTTFGGMTVSADGYVHVATGGRLYLIDADGFFRHVAGKYPLAVSVVTGCRNRADLAGLLGAVRWTARHDGCGERFGDWARPGPGGGFLGF